MFFFIWNGPVMFEKPTDRDQLQIDLRDDDSSRV